MASVDVEEGEGGAVEGAAAEVEEEEDADADIPVLCRGRGILGHVLHYAIRLEYQGRGKAHYHVRHLLSRADSP